MDDGVRAQRVARPARRPPACPFATCTTACVSAGCVRIRTRWLAAGRALSGRPSVPRHADLALPRVREKDRGAACDVGAADSMGVALVALEEVSGAGRARDAAAAWSVATTRELPGAPSIAQHVGVAWRRGVACATVERSTRWPTAAFPSVRCGRDSRSPSCRGQAGPRAGRATQGRLPQSRPRRAADGQGCGAAATSGGCHHLRLRDAALPATRTRGWIDAHAGADFAVLGDFNRTMLREPVADSPTYRTRLDGSAASDPLGRCTIERRKRA